jgi:hypothetical protein
MSELKEKVLKRLDELIQEGEQLKNTEIKENDPGFNMWHTRCRTFLERLGGDKLTGSFNTAGALPFAMNMSDKEAVLYRKRQVEGRTGFLKVTKEDLALFDEKDEPGLARIRYKFEGGDDPALLKGKYTYKIE